MTTSRVTRALRTLIVLLPLVALLLMQAGCGSDGSSSFGDNKHPGTEGGACDDGKCDEGLDCLSNVCVDPQSSTSSTGGDTTNASGVGVDGTGGMSNGISGGSSSDTSSTSSGGGSSTASTMSSGGTGVTSGDSSGGAAGASVDGASTDGVSTAGISTSGAAGETGMVECEGAHPNVNGQVRSCDAGSCYCVAEPADTCFPADIVEACCAGAIRCGSDSEPPRVDCTGEHPLVTDETRTCDPGNCLCSDGETVDKCLPAGVARICCPASVELDCVAAE